MKIAISGLGLTAALILGGLRSPEDPTTDSLTMVPQLGQSLVPIGEAAEVLFCVDLEGIASKPTERVPVNLSLVIDRSGSMESEQKLSHAKRAARLLIERLGAEDHVSLVAYDNDVEVLLGSTCVENTQELEAIISRLEPGGSTNLCGGMLEGFAQVRERYESSRLNRVVLLSDGLANHGVSDPAAIGHHAEYCRNQGVQVTTMGVGVDYDDILMSRIAERSGGQYYYISEPDKMRDVFYAELDRWGGTIAREIKVEMALEPGIEVVEVYGYETEKQGSNVIIPVGDMVSEQRRKVLMKLRIPAGDQNQADVGTVRVLYRDAATGCERSLKTSPVKVGRSAIASAIEASRDLSVLTKAEIVRNAQAMIEAAAHLEKGDHDRVMTLLLQRMKASAEANERIYRSEELTRQIAALGRSVERAKAAKNNRTALRDAQIRGRLEALGYIK